MATILPDPKTGLCPTGMRWNQNLGRCVYVSVKEGGGPAGKPKDLARALKRLKSDAAA